MSAGDTWMRYLLWFANEHNEFHLPEIDSLLKALNIPLRWVENPIENEVYWIVEFPTEACARLLCSRAVCVRWCIELWAKAPSLQELKQHLTESLSNDTMLWKDKVCPRNIMDPYFDKDKTFKVNVETFSKHFTLSEKVKKIEFFTFLPLDGSVRLKDPDTELMYLEHYGLDHRFQMPEDPYHLFFGRLVCEGQRQLISELSLKKRKFIGNTSMDAQLSLLMANTAQVLPGDLVLDPFVGTGSLLVAAALFGGYVMGTDIDFLMMHGRTKPSRVTQKVREKDENILANMRQYNIEEKYVEVVVADFSLPLWRDSLRLDAIITDPPYGIREPTEKIGIHKENYTLSEEHFTGHVPAKVDYHLTTIFNDLLAFAAQHLAINRRLVCWLPYFREDYTEDMIPNHKCLRLLHNSEQILSKLTARRLLTYQKISEPNNLDSQLPANLNSKESNLNAKVNKDVKEEEIVPDKEQTIDNQSLAMDVSDFRQKYFFSAEETRRERKEKRKQDKERGQIQKELRLKREMEVQLGKQNDNGR